MNCELIYIQVELKQRYKFRLILDETWSYGVLGRTGAGLTEHQNVDPTLVDMIIGSLAGPLCAGGGFCAGSADIVEHQRISSAAYTFSAALPAMLATTASETIALLQDNQEPIITLRDNIKVMRQQLDPRSEWIRCSSNADNAMQILVLKSEVVSARKLSVPEQEVLMQEFVDEVSCSSRHQRRVAIAKMKLTGVAQILANGVLVARIKNMPVPLGAAPKDHGWQPVPALKVCVTAGLSRKEIEKAGITIRHAITKVMTKKR